MPQPRLCLQSPIFNICMSSSSLPAPSPKPARAASSSALAPLGHPTFRILWLVWVTANICMWMNDVAAAWMMTSLTALPIWVALVQTASTLPVFLLGLPSGALADILDRRKYLVFTQFWVAGVAGLLALVVFSGAVNPPLLLALTLFNGIGLAMRWPVFAAIIPELVPRAQLPSALALNGVAMNLSRIVGPLVAGAVIAHAGSGYVFVLNAALSVVCGFVILRWERPHVPNPLGRERLLSAMRVGMQYVGQSSRLKAILLRIFVFFFHSSALLALLPLVAKNLQGGNASVFTLLLASMGSGAIAAALLLPRVRDRFSRDTVVIAGSALQAAAILVVALVPYLPVVVVALVAAGVAWISTANALSVSAQTALPDWVRARGMSMYQMAIMGGSALGAATWGQLATLTDVPTAQVVSGVSGLLVMLACYKFVADRDLEEDLSTSRAFTPPVAHQTPLSGKVVTTIEYRIDPEYGATFCALMQESRRSRLRQGALSWQLLHDIEDPGRYVEQIVDESWTEHLRRFERMTAADVALHERKRGLHVGALPPVVSRLVVTGGRRG